MKSGFRHINTKILKTYANGDRGFERELIEIFRAQVAMFTSNLENFYREKEWTNLAREAHTAKSSAMVFGMNDTVDDLKLIQSLAERHDRENLSTLIEKVTKDLHSAAEELEEYQKE